MLIKFIIPKMTNVAVAQDRFAHLALAMYKQWHDWS